MALNPIKSLFISLVVTLLGATVAYKGMPTTDAFADADGHVNTSRLYLYPTVIACVFCIQWIAFIPSNLFKTERFYDLCGGGTYFTVTLAMVLYIFQQNSSQQTPPLSSRSIVIALCIMVWAFRLAGFLFLRVLKRGHDDRFDEIKKDTFRFFNVWHIQGLWVTVTSSAGWISITNDNGSSAPSTLETLCLVVGFAVWLSGFAFEVVADSQKNAFNSSENNKSTVQRQNYHPSSSSTAKLIGERTFITNGLWSISRHPNYFGEIVLWFGVSIMALPTFVASATGVALCGGLFFCFLSPLFVSLLLNFVSGVHLLEKKGELKWGGRPDYEAYKQRTPILVPFIGKRGDHPVALSVRNASKKSE